MECILKSKMDVWVPWYFVLVRLQTQKIPLLQHTEVEVGLFIYWLFHILKKLYIFIPCLYSFTRFFLFTLANVQIFFHFIRILSLYRYTNFITNIIFFLRTIILLNWFLFLFKLINKKFLCVLKSSFTYYRDFEKLMSLTVIRRKKHERRSISKKIVL